MSDEAEQDRPLPPGTRRITEAELEYLAQLPDLTSTLGPFPEVWLTLPFREPIPLRDFEARVLRDAILSGMWGDL